MLQILFSVPLPNFAFSMSICPVLIKLNESRCLFTAVLADRKSVETRVRVFYKYIFLCMRIVGVVEKRERNE